MFFFDERYATFEMFSVAHLVPVLLVVAAVVLLAVFRRRLNGTGRFDRLFRIVFGAVPVLMEFVFYAWALTNGGWQWTMLPFGLCAISMYLTAVALIFRCERLARIVYPWAIAGALLSLIVADQPYVFPHFRYLHYFGNHGMFLIANVYLRLVDPHPYRWADVLRSSAILLGLAVPLYFLNGALGTNHMFLAELPAEVAGMFLWLGDGWVFGFGFAIFLLLNIVSLPFLIRSKSKSAA